MAEKEVKSVDPATREILKKAAEDGARVVFERAETMKPCPIGGEGSCCSLCAMGPCIDNSPIVMAATAVVKEGGLGDDLSELPVTGAAPEWMSEKAPIENAYDSRTEQQLPSLISS